MNSWKGHFAFPRVVHVVHVRQGKRQKEKAASPEAIDDAHTHSVCGVSRTYLRLLRARGLELRTLETSKMVVQAKEAGAVDAAACCHGCISRP